MKRLLILVLLILASTSFAQIDDTPMINYQGRLTTADSAPVADGNYQVTFNIYASIGAPSPIWTSGQQSVTVTGGIFNYLLGIANPLPHNTFDNRLRYLGITVGSDPEISPRIRFTAVPYSYRALKSDTAGVVLNEDDFVHTAGDTIKGDLFFDGDDDGTYEGLIDVSTASANIYMRSNDTTTVRLYGASYGELALYHGTNGRRRTVLAASSLGGRLRLYDSDADEQIELYAGTSGNGSVQLPDNAIDADEILNEPGIVSNTGLSPDLTTSSFVDIATVTISTPGPGYVYVSAHCGIIFSGTTGLNAAYVQIDTTAGGGNLGEDVFVFKWDFPSTESRCERVFADRVYYIDAARTITFRLEGARYASSTGDVTTTRSRIKAMFFPTAYGSVKANVLDLDGFTDTETVTVRDGLGNSRTEFKVDLRELELQAKEAKIRALEAEQALEEAREALERENRE